MSSPRSLPRRKHFAIQTKKVAHENVKNSSTAINSAISNVLDTVDHASTYVRNGQVFTAVQANGGAMANGDDVAGSAFNNLIHEGGDPSGNLNMVGWGFAAIIGAAYGIGITRAAYRASRKLRTNSYSYIEARMREVDKRTGTIRNVPHYDTFINYGQQLLDKNAIVGGNQYELTKDPKNYKKKYIDFARKPNADSLDADFVGIYETKPAARDDKTKTSKLTQFINKVSNSKVANGLSYIWNWASNNAYIFWIVWMPFALAAGTAATFTLPFLPIIVGITLGLGAIFTLWKIAEMALTEKRKKDQLHKIDKVLNGKDADSNFAKKVARIQAKKIAVKHIQHLDPVLKAAFKANPAAFVDIDSLDDPQYGPKLKAKVIAKILKDLSNAEAKRFAHVKAELKQRVYIKYEHAALMNQLLPNYGWNDDGKNKKSDVQRAFKLEYQRAKTAYFDKIANDSTAKRSFEALDIAAKAKFKNHVRGSQAERHGRLATSVILSLIGGFVGPLFVLWLASSIISIPVLFGVAALAATAAILGGSMLYTVGGAIVGALFGIQTAAQRRQAQLDYDHRVNVAMSTNYKNEKISKASKFCQLDALVQEKIAILNQDPKKVRELKAMGFNINKIDPYNDYYFEKQKAQPSGWTWLKKGLNRVYQSLGGGQTGVLITRSLFLVGCVFAPALAVLPFGGPIAFVAVAMVMAIIVGGLRVAQYQQERKQQHREFFVETIDARISYLKKKDKELTAALNMDNNASQQAPAPTPSVPPVELKEVVKKKKVKPAPANDGESAPLLGDSTLDKKIRKKLVEKTDSFGTGTFESLASANGMFASKSNSEQSLNVSLSSTSEEDSNQLTA